MFTVWVGGNERESPAHAVVKDVCDLPDVLHGFPPMTRGNGGAAGGAPFDAASRKERGTE